MSWQGGSGQWASCIRVVEPSDLSTAEVLELDNNEAALSICLVAFTARPDLGTLLAVGTAQGLQFYPRQARPCCPTASFMTPLGMGPMPTLVALARLVRDQGSMGGNTGVKMFVSHRVAGVAVKMHQTGCCVGAVPMSSPAPQDAAAVSCRWERGQAMPVCKSGGFRGVELVPSTLRMISPALQVDAGFIRIYQMDNGRKLSLLHKTQVEDIPRAMQAFQGRLLVGVGHTLRLYDIGKKRLLRKCENRQFPTLIVTLHTMGDRIYVGDCQVLAPSPQVSCMDLSSHLSFCLTSSLI